MPIDVLLLLREINIKILDIFVRSYRWLELRITEEEL